MVTKKELRIEAKSTRTMLDIKNISEKIVEKILNLEAYKKAQNIMLFYPLPHEINLTKLFEETNKNFYLPRMDGENLKICPYKLNDELTVSKFKTKEPTTEPIKNIDSLDIIFVPALMVDKTFNRLGYGGGFYDKLLAETSPKIVRITAIPSVLIIDELPLDKFDERVDIIISENLILIK